MLGFYRAECAWWEAIAASIEKPWPEEAACQDLRFWANERSKGARTVPGRRVLCKRWGWSDWQVRKLMRDEFMWADPFKMESTTHPPHSLPTQPHEERANVDNDKEISHLNTTPTTLPPSRDPLPKQVNKETQKKPAPEREVFEHYLGLYKAWMKSKGRTCRKKSMSKGEREAIKARLSEAGCTVETAKLVATWAFHGKDQYAGMLQGRVAIDGRKREYLSIETIYKIKKWGMREELALAMADSSPTIRWQLDTPEQVDAALANGLGDYMRDNEIKFGGDDQLFYNAFAKVVDGEFADFYSLLRRAKEATI